MERFYVLEPNTVLRKSGSLLLLMRGAEKLAEIPLEGLEQLVLTGYASLTGAVLDTLIRNRVETVFLTPRGRFRARLLMDEHKHVQRRRAQYLRLSRQEIAVRLARSIVRGKLRNSARFLALRGSQYGDEFLRETAARIRALGTMVESVDDLDVLRGIEGQGGALYFRAFPRLIRVEGFVFEGRSRRPPLDAVNALLSFVYTLLTLEVLNAVKTAGLDPYLGSLHDIEYGRPSLACDLVEEWRAFLGDRLVLSLVNRRVVQPEDFIQRSIEDTDAVDEGSEDFIQRSIEDTDAVDEEDLKRKRPVEMKPKTAKAFIQAYEAWMASPVPLPGKGQKTDHRGLIRFQVRRFLGWLMGEAESYEPFLWSEVQ